MEQFRGTQVVLDKRRSREDSIGEPAFFRRSVSFG